MRARQQVDRTACPRWQAGKTEDWEHGNSETLKKGCRCPDAYRDKERRRKLRKAGVHARVDSVGSSRRVAALLCMAWRCEDVAVDADLSVEHVRAILRREHPWVHETTAASLARVYDAKAMVFGPSPSGAKRSLNRGFLPPLAWDDDTIDDPGAQPYSAAVHHIFETEHAEFDERLKVVEHLHHDFSNVDEPDLMAPFALVNAPKLWRSMSVIDRDYALTELRKHLTVPEIAARVGVPDGHVADAWSGAMRRARNTQKQTTDAA